MGGLFVLVDSLAILAVFPFDAAGSSVFVNPGEPLNLVYLFSIILISTGLILLISRFFKRIIQVILLGSVAFLSFDVFLIFFANVLSEFPALFLSVAASVAMIVLLITFPEWYVIDASCVIVGVGTTTMLGISLNVPLVIILLIIMALYDAISV